MDCKFVVGQKAVCIMTYESDPWPYTGSDLPKKGAIGTITSIEPFLGWGLGTNRDVVGLQFKEYRALNRGGEWWYDAEHWAPLVENKTDISELQKLLTPAPKEPVKEIRRKVKEDAYN